MKIISLVMASSLILIALAFSRYQELKLEKEIIIGVIRAVIQLTLIGLVLEFIFGLENPWVTTLLLLVMIFNAARVSAGRGDQIQNAGLIAFGSIFIGAWVTLGVLLLVGALQFQPSQVIPVMGMIVGNSMTAVGLTFKQLQKNFHDQTEEVEIKLALGAGPLDAANELIRDAVRTGMIPRIDSMKILGIVQLPGMMTGLILAGESPVKAIQYQIMVTFMLISTVSIATFIAGFTGYRGFFNEQSQVVLK